MLQIVFICHSNLVDQYWFNCAQAVANQLDNVMVTFLKDQNVVAPKTIRFNKIINFVDKRFSNFKQDPYSTVDINDIVNSKIKIAHQLQAIGSCDWLVLQNKAQLLPQYLSFAKKGLISLDVDYHYLKNNVLSHNKLQYTMQYLPLYEANWQTNVVALDSEQGLQNNIFKLLFNTNIYLVRFLINYSIDNTTNASIASCDNLRPFVATSYYLRLIRKLIVRKLRKKNLSWKIAVKHNNELTFVNQPKKSFWADPFLISDKEINYIFFEELKPNGLGAISCIVLNENFEITDKQIILDKEYHLSFPNVFELNEQFYLIPESSANNSLDLYYCKQFPFDWQFQKILIDNIRLIDPILLFHDNIYWIFANKIEDFEFDNNERLYLFYTNDLFSDKWQSHPQNPIVHNASLAHNAGKIYTQNNKMYRVSQNCSSSYGQNLVISQITTLTTTQYNEQKCEEIYSDKKYNGMHTMNNAKNIQVFDFLVAD